MRCKCSSISSRHFSSSNGFLTKRNYGPTSKHRGDNDDDDRMEEVEENRCQIALFYVGDIQDFLTKIIEQMYWDGT